MTDKGLFAIGIKEGSGDESQQCEGVQLGGSQLGALCKTREVISARKAMESLPSGVWRISRARPRQSKRNAES